MKVFVSVGNAVQPFDRMLSAVDAALGQFPGQFEGTCQHGTSSVRPMGLAAVPYVDRARFEDEMRDTDIAILHAGVGSVHTALRNGLRPIVFGRRADLGEHADDHQLQLVSQFARANRVLVAHDAASLALVLDDILKGRETTRGARPTNDGGGIASIREALSKGRPASRLAGLRRAPLAVLALSARLLGPMDCSGPGDRRPK